MKYLKTSLVLFIIALAFQSCNTSDQNVSDNSSDGCNKLLDKFTQEELDGLYLQEELTESKTFKRLKRDSTVADTVGGKVEFRNFRGMVSSHRRWQGRVISSSANDNGKEVLLTSSHSFGLIAIKELLADIEYYNKNAVANGLDSITGIRTGQYIKKVRGQEPDYMDAYLVPVTYNGKAVPKYVDKTKSNTVTTLTYNISNPCPDTCD